MGYSDLGCYGSEIRTPNLDGLAAEGLRFSQMYNFARCCPSRAALLTGLYPHQAGIGHMAGGIPNAPGYGGYLRHSAVTIAQVLKERGYRTLMSGKWHCGKRPNSADSPPEMQHGFDRLFGLGRNSGYFGGRTCTLDGTPIAANPTDFYLTDAISDHAVDFISESADQPFFMYVAYTAPHWPLHAFEEDIARYQGQLPQRWLGRSAHRPPRNAQRHGSRQRPLGHIAPRRGRTPWHEAADPDWKTDAWPCTPPKSIAWTKASAASSPNSANTTWRTTPSSFPLGQTAAALNSCARGNRIDWVFLQASPPTTGGPYKWATYPV